jgi:hypothetical protein
MNDFIGLYTRRLAGSWGNTLQQEDTGMTVHGTTAWFNMVGTLLENAAWEATLPPNFNFCFLERFIDGIELNPGLVQGLRFDIIGGRPSFRTGVQKVERGDLTVEITTSGSHVLNRLYDADPRYKLTIAALKKKGELIVDGDFLQLGRWFHGVHDEIVDRTL